MVAPSPVVDRRTYRVAPDAQQHNRREHLPFGTRGGMLVQHLFLHNGEYDITADLRGRARRQELVEIAIDGEQVTLIPVDPKSSLGPYSSKQKTVAVRVPVKAGLRSVGVAFYKRAINLVEEVQEPFPNPGVPFSTPPAGDMPYLTSVTVVGPYNPMGPGDTPSRRRIFTCRPASAEEEVPCAKAILSQLARRAYRGTQTDANVDVLLDFYRRGSRRLGDLRGGHQVRVAASLGRFEVSFPDRAGSATSRRERGGPCDLSPERSRACVASLVLLVEHYS